MGKAEDTKAGSDACPSPSEPSAVKNKQKNQGRKRKRSSSGSSNDDDKMILPDNAFETDRNVHISAVKNNLDETSVRKIIKKVVTNDHVLALVKLREEEENSSPEDKELQPKLTRAKVKELKKVSPQTAWNLENLELTPINHIPVKTRPEVKALIAQELQEDEDDDEYEPTHDDGMSDDDHGLESCSDVDSQPRTPATPATVYSPSPMQDGPFKVPQEVSSARRKLNIEEEATIALRTRSKLSLSATPIEHIEATFVPPDELPIQDVDDLWNDFLNECLNPASTSRNEDDDEADPEYNVAADADAHDEDEEGLGNSLIKISKKELNDLVTELFSVMPADEELAENLANSVLTNNSQTEIPVVAKQEPQSDEEVQMKPSQRLTFEKNSYPMSIGKTEPDDTQEINNTKEVHSGKENKKSGDNVQKPAKRSAPCLTISSIDNKVHISVEQINVQTHAPPSLRPKLSRPKDTVHIQIVKPVTITPEQRVILQQQIRQHVQLAASNFLQLYVHPVHWKMAPAYKDYLETLTKLTEKNKDSVVNVCNLQLAMELVSTWESSVSEDTPVNREMIDFIQKEVDRNRRRASQNCLYAGDFHETFLKTVANSRVFLYPFLLPPMPYRPDKNRRFYYLQAEDRLIVIGLDQFRLYVQANPQLYRLRTTSARSRRGLTAALELVVKHMMPWTTAKALASHLHNVNSTKDENSPIYRYFKYEELPTIEHKIMPYNPHMTLYDQPEHEVPRMWVRYLAKTSRKFKKFFYKRITTYQKPPEGVPIQTGVETETSTTPLPNDFTKQIISGRTILHQEPEVTIPISSGLADNNNIPLIAKNFFKLVQTSTGAYLLPLDLNTQTVNVNNTPITTPIEQNKKITEIEHCTCCKLLRKLSKRQKLITEYFSKNSKKCDCNVKYPKVTTRLKMLLRNYKNVSELCFNELERRLSGEKGEDLDPKELTYVLKYQLKVISKSSMSRRIYVKKRVHNILTNFKEETDDPVKLSEELFKAFDVELVDLYMDFLGFLTPEQVDRLNRFREYFTRNCARDLMDRIDEQVKDTDARKKILTQIKTICTESGPNSCEMCTSLLNTMNGYPTLAEYTFKLFPHRKQQRSKEIVIPNIIENSEPNDTIAEEHTADYEADHSSSGEDSDVNLMVVDQENETEQNGQPDQEPSEELLEGPSVPIAVKKEPTDTYESQITLEITEIDSKQDDSDSDTPMSINIGEIKIDPPDWRRDEDKLILEVLQDLLTPQERKDKTVAVILGLLEEKNVYTVISQGLDRPIEEIKERLLYLLSLLVMSESAS